jgi:hypothetical protein
MAEKQVFPVETADSPTDMIAQGAQAGSDHGRLLEKTTGDSISPPRNKRSRTGRGGHAQNFLQSLPRFAGTMTPTATCSTA